MHPRKNDINHKEQKGLKKSGFFKGSLGLYTYILIYLGKCFDIQDFDIPAFNIDKAFFTKG